ncbi:alpha/beta hydrolase [Acinetobacter sp.]|jgi:pimeloyl-ACP methyl ester carboxylesterase|uniref:alpha/beta fold hydrolase n=1 Tax=Acinetobacter sp. TaxID=472 RepID=UPI0028378A4E|nr:alpha/beta hydrolase [Acinetobacter sp.]MDR0237634.1 alpha/beta hydrolase [Acinetobacter sp.]
MCNIKIVETWLDLKLGVFDAKLYVKTWIPHQHLATPIILLHDSLGSVQLWRDFPEKLAEITGCQIIAYDRLGFGQSSEHPNILDIDFVRNEAIEVFSVILEQLKIQDFIVMGHSVGGGMATHCSVQYPQQCKALITISAQSFVEQQTLTGIQDAKTNFQHVGQMDRLKKYHGEKAQWVLAAWTETWLSSEFSHWHLKDTITQIQCPLLVIHGELDEYGSLAQPQQFINYASGKSQMEIIKGAKHMPHKENPEQILEIIQSFITDLDVA